MSPLTDGGGFFAGRLAAMMIEGLFTSLTPLLAVTEPTYPIKTIWFGSTNSEELLSSFFFLSACSTSLTAIFSECTARQIRSNRPLPSLCGKHILAFGVIPLDNAGATIDADPVISMLV